MNGREPENNIVAITLQYHVIQVRDLVSDMCEPCLPGRCNSLVNRTLSDVEGVVLTSELVLCKPSLELAAAAADCQDALDGSALGKIRVDEVLEPVAAIRAAGHRPDPGLNGRMLQPVEALSAPFPCLFTPDLANPSLKVFRQFPNSNSPIMPQLDVGVWEVGVGILDYHRSYGCTCPRPPACLAGASPNAAVSREYRSHARHRRGRQRRLFSILQAVLLQPLPYRDPDRVVMIWNASASREAVNWRRGATTARIVAWHDESRDVFEDTAAFKLWTGNLESQIDLITPAGAERLRGGLVTSNFFSTLGVAAASGRVFTAEMKWLAQVIWRCSATPSGSARSAATPVWSADR